MPEMHPFVQFVALVLGPTGACWIAVKSSLNGARKDIKETRADVREIRGTLSGHGDRLTRIETQIEERT